jgi:hypothetical protein
MNTSGGRGYLRRVFAPYVSQRVLLAGLVLNLGFLFTILFTDAYSTHHRFSPFEAVLTLFYAPQALFSGVFLDLVFGRGHPRPRGLVYPLVFALAYPVCLLYARVFFGIVASIRARAK